MTDVIFLRLKPCYVCIVKSTQLMKKLDYFTVWTPNEYGLGCFKIKAIDFNDAYRRLGKKDKLKRGWIENEDGESFTFNQILNIEE